MSTDLEDRLGTALHARAAQLTVDPARLDPSSVTGQARTARHVRAWLAVAASVAAVALIAAGVLAFARNGRTDPGQPSLARPQRSTDATAATISGTLRMVGGLYPGLGQGIPGTITVVHPDTPSTSTIKLQTDAEGRFTFTIRPGEYLIEGTSPKYNDGRVACTGGTFVLAAGSRETRNVLCQVK